MAKYPSKGVIVKYGATAVPTAALINKAEVSFEDGDRTLIDSTTHENTTAKSYLDSGLRDTFAVSMRLLLDPADTVHEMLRAHHNAGTLGYLTLVLPDEGAAEWTGAGYITSYTLDGLTPQGDLVARVRFKYAAAETYTQ